MRSVKHSQYSPPSSHNEILSQPNCTLTLQYSYFLAKLHKLYNIPTTHLDELYRLIKWQWENQQYCYEQSWAVKRQYYESKDWQKEHEWSVVQPPKPPYNANNSQSHHNVNNSASQIDSLVYSYPETVHFSAFQPGRNTSHFTPEEQHSNSRMVMSELFGYAEKLSVNHRLLKYLVMLLDSTVDSEYSAVGRSGQRENRGSLRDNSSNSKNNEDRKYQYGYNKIYRESIQQPKTIQTGLTFSNNRPNSRIKSRLQYMHSKLYRIKYEAQYSSAPFFRNNHITTSAPSIPQLIFPNTTSSTTHSKQQSQLYEYYPQSTVGNIGGYTSSPSPSYIDHSRREQEELLAVMQIGFRGGFKLENVKEDFSQDYNCAETEYFDSMHSVKESYPLNVANHRGHGETKDNYNKYNSGNNKDSNNANASAHQYNEDNANADPPYPIPEYLPNATDNKRLAIDQARQVQSEFVFALDPYDYPQKESHFHEPSIRSQYSAVRVRHTNTRTSYYPQHNINATDTVPTTPIHPPNPTFNSSFTIISHDSNSTIRSQHNPFNRNSLPDPPTKPSSIPIANTTSSPSPTTPSLTSPKSLTRGAYYSSHDEHHYLRPKKTFDYLKHKPKIVDSSQRISEGSVSMSEDIEDHIIKTIRNNVKHVHVMSNFSGVKIGDKAKGSKDGEIGVYEQKKSYSQKSKETKGKQQVEQEYTESKLYLVSQSCSISINNPQHASEPALVTVQPTPVVEPMSNRNTPLNPTPTANSKQNPKMATILYSSSVIDMIDSGFMQSRESIVSRTTHGIIENNSADTIRMLNNVKEKEETGRPNKESMPYQIGRVSNVQQTNLNIYNVGNSVERSQGSTSQQKSSWQPMYPLPPKSFQVSFEQPRPQPHTLSSSRTYYLPNPHKYLRPYNVPQHQIPPATLLPKSSLAPHSAPIVRNSSSHAILRPTSASIRLPPHSPVLSSPIKSINHLQITTFNPGQHDQYDKIVTTSPTLRQSVQRGHSTVTHKMQHNQSSNHSQQHLLNNSHQHSLNNSQQYSSRMASYEKNDEHRKYLIYGRQGSRLKLQSQKKQGQYSRIIQIIETDYAPHKNPLTKKTKKFSFKHRADHNDLAQDNPSPPTQKEQGQSLSSPTKANPKPNPYLQPLSLELPNPIPTIPTIPVSPAYPNNSFSSDYTFKRRPSIHRPAQEQTASKRMYLPIEL